MEAPPVVHPAADVLRAFALGKLDEASALHVLAHVEVCRACCAHVSGVSGDGFLARLRAAQSNSGTALPPGKVPPAPAAPTFHALSTQLPALQAQPTQLPVTVPPTVAGLPPELRDHEQYEVLAELGRGGMGVVYLVRNRNMVGRLEVIKVISPHLLGQSGVVERFMREIEAAARLSHAHIVTAYAVLRKGSLLGLAMEYVAGQDLAKVVAANGPLPVSNACAYAMQTALGLQYAFEKGMVHRDIKPPNLILDSSGKQHVVKIVDFGLAKVTSEETQATHNLTATGAMMGTPHYLAPEQALDASRADIRADLYSLGCTLYFLLTGTPPFQGKSLKVLLEAHETQQAVPLDQLRKDVPAKLAAVVAKLMAKEPGQRHQTPVEVARALKPFTQAGVKPLRKETGTPLAVPSPEPAPRRKDPAPVRATPVEPLDAGARPAAAPPPLPSKTVIEGSNTIKRARRATAPSAPLQATRLEGDATIARAQKQRTWSAAQGKGSRRWLFGVGMVALLLAVVVGLWAAGVIRLKTPEGILVVEIDEQSADVYVDGSRMLVSWGQGKDGRQAELRIKPGTHWVEVRKDGIIVKGADVEIQDGGRRILTARVRPEKPPTAVGPPQKKPPQKRPPKESVSPPPVKPPSDVVSPPKRPGSETGVVKEKVRPALLDCTGPNGVSAEKMHEAQEAWAKYLGVKVEETVEIADGVTMTFVLIPPGKFQMGSPREEQDYVTKTFYDGKRPSWLDDESSHVVTLTEPFYLGKYEVTQAQYEALAEKDKTPSKFKGDNLPVENVSWEMARSCAANLKKILGDKHVYRLPTEAEWEYSCRGGRSSSQPFGIGDGHSLSSLHANFDGKSPYGGADPGRYLKKTSPVGSYQANALGLCDMHGNVWEWCADWYGPYPAGDVTNPSGPSEGSYRVIRGGCWSYYARCCRSAFRYGRGPGFRSYNLGFRLARNVPSVGK